MFVPAACLQVNGPTCRQEGGPVRLSSATGLAAPTSSAQPLPRLFAHTWVLDVPAISCLPELKLNWAQAISADLT